MMKRILGCIALMAVCLSAVAQTAAGFTKSAVRPSLAKAATAPQKAALDGTTLWGYYGGDIEGDLIGVGVSRATTYWAGYFVPGDGLLKGSVINGVNLPLASITNMADVSIWITKDLSADAEVSQDVPMEQLKGAAYNAIALDTPYQLPETGVYVGVKFTITKAAYDADNYPVLIGGSPQTNSLVMKYGTAAWGDYSGQFSASFAMQLFLSNLLNVPAAYIYPTAVYSSSALVGSKGSLRMALCSEGSADVNSIDYTVDIAGNKQTNRLTLDTPIKAGFNQTRTVNLDFTAPQTPGSYTVTVNIDKVNGEANTLADSSLTTTVKAVSRIVTRNTVVEEMTGTGCGNCPRGWVGMEYMKENCTNFIGIAWHYYNSSDPMYTAAYAKNLGLSGAPSCVVDRKSGVIDPYFGSGSYYLDIVNDFNFYNAMAPDVAVTVDGKFNAAGTEVAANASVEYLLGGEDYTIVFALTADSLKGTTSAWRQHNYYVGSPTPDEPLIAQFCNGGIYNSEYVYLTYNDVLIGSSYSALGINNAVLTGDGTVGSTGTSSYTIKMPTKVSLKSAIKLDYVYITALVIDKEGQIANAARAKVELSDELLGIDGVSGNGAAGAKEVARYNAAGQRITAPQKGLNIVKLSNGETLKVIEK